MNSGNEEGSGGDGAASSSLPVSAGSDQSEAVILFEGRRKRNVGEWWVGIDEALKKNKSSRPCQEKPSISASLSQAIERLVDSGGDARQVASISKLIPSSSVTLHHPFGAESETTKIIHKDDSKSIVKGPFFKIDRAGDSPHYFLQRTQKHVNGRVISEYAALSDPGIANADGILLRAKFERTSKKSVIRMHDVFKKMNGHAHTVLCTQAYVCCLSQGMFIAMNKTKNSIAVNKVCLIPTLDDCAAHNQTLLANIPSTSELIVQCLDEKVETTLVADLQLQKDLYLKACKAYKEFTSNKDAIQEAPSDLFVLVLFNPLFTLSGADTRDISEQSLKCIFNQTPTNCSLVMCKEVNLDGTKHDFLIALEALDITNPCSVSQLVNWMLKIPKAVRVSHMSDDCTLLETRSRKICGPLGKTDADNEELFSGFLEMSIMVSPEKSTLAQSLDLVKKGKEVSPFMTLVGSALQFSFKNNEPHKIPRVLTNPFRDSVEHSWTGYLLKNFKNDIKKCVFNGIIHRELQWPVNSRCRLHFQIYTLWFNRMMQSEKLDLLGFVLIFVVITIVSSKCITLPELLMSLSNSTYMKKKCSFEESECRFFYSLYYLFMCLKSTILRTMDVVYGKPKGLPITWLKCVSSLDRATPLCDLLQKERSNPKLDKRFTQGTFPDYSGQINYKSVVQMLSVIGQISKLNDSANYEDVQRILHASEQMAGADAVAHAYSLIDSIFQWKAECLPDQKEDGTPLFPVSGAPEADAWNLPEADTCFEGQLPPVFTFPGSFLAAPSPAAAAPV